MFNNERRDRDPDDELRAYVRGAQLAEPRLTTTLLSLFATLALILTATGLAGVIGYGVMRRALLTDPAGVFRGA